MNKWNQLLEVLDEVFGFEEKAKSTAKKLRQYFEERTNEDVFVIEYQVRTENTLKSALPPAPKVPVKKAPAGKGSKKLL